VDWRWAPFRNGKVGHQGKDGAHGGKSDGSLEDRMISKQMKAKITKKNLPGEGVKDLL